MGKEGRYKKEAKEVDIWNIGVRGAISVSRSPKSASANINIWDIVGYTPGQKYTGKCILYMRVIIQRGCHKNTHSALLHTIKHLHFSTELTQHTEVRLWRRSADEART